ncbi:NADH-quinone oxidoreductase subunit NuoE [Candidatus Omnitrophota bacterium]
MDKKLKKIFSTYQGSRDELIPILQKTQEQFGYLSKTVMLEIAKFTHLPESRVYAVATFYAQFRFSPIGKKHIVVCRGTSCHVRGAKQILQNLERQLGIQEGETSADRKYSLETVACIGACGLSPCVMVNKKVIAKMTPKKIARIFKR